MMASQVTQTIEAATSAIRNVRCSRTRALALAAAPVAVAVLVVAMLELKSVQYGLPISDLLEPQTARLWVYETITDDGLLAPAPAFVKVRWKSDIADATRAGLEARYRIVPVEARERLTWVYRLERFSHANVRALLADPAVEDTEGFDRRGFGVPAESLSVALERAVRFAPVRLLLQPFSGSYRAWLADVLRRLVDPLVQWSFLGALAVLACLPLIRRAELEHYRTLDRRWMAAVEDLVLTRPGGRSLGRAAAYVAIVAVALAVSHRSSLLPKPELTNSPFAVHALDLAVTRALCGTTSSVTPLSPGSAVLRDEAMAHMPIPELVSRLAGDVPRYCAGARPFRNPENSPMLLMSGMLLWAPRLTVAALGGAMHAIKLTLVLATGFMCLAMGTSLLGTYLIQAVAIDTVDRIGHTYVQYSFLGIVLACVAVSWAFVERRRAGTAAYHRAAAALLGVATAFAAHVRSSHLPIYAAFLVLHLLLMTFGRRVPAYGTGTSRAAWAGAAVAAFAGGYLTFILSFIAPIDRATVDANVNYTSHATAHAIVLGLSLASPEALEHPETVAGSELARREGFTFDDAKGIMLARRIDPSVQYLDGAYESALWSYYMRLWRQHPGEMVALYGRKFQLTGENIRQYLRGDDLNPVLRFSSRVLDASWPASMPLFALYFLVFASAIVVHRRTSSSTACVLAFFSLAAMLVYLEATMVIPAFRLAYYNFTPIYVGTVAVLGLQAALTHACRIAGWRTQHAA